MSRIDANNQYPVLKTNQRDPVLLTSQNYRECAGVSYDRSQMHGVENHNQSAGGARQELSAFDINPFEEDADIYLFKNYKMKRNIILGGDKPVSTF